MLEWSKLLDVRGFGFALPGNADMCCNGMLYWKSVVPKLECVVKEVNHTKASVCCRGR